jgi:hypothetical protein
MKVVPIEEGVAELLVGVERCSVVSEWLYIFQPPRRDDNIFLLE